jgi:hypothetical protein
MSPGCFVSTAASGPAMIGGSARIDGGAGHDPVSQDQRLIGGDGSAASWAAPMSKHETPMTRRYWQRVGGTLIEEYPAVLPGHDRRGRWLDGVIITDGEHKIAARGEPADLDGHDVIIVQTKAGRLGMYLLGQALFSAELIKARFVPKSVRTVALCGKDDAVLRPIAERYGIEIIVDG